MDLSSGFLDLSESKEIHEDYWFLRARSTVQIVSVPFCVYYTADKKKQKM